MRDLGLKELPSWMGIDSRDGRYLFGADKPDVIDGLVLLKQTATIVSTAHVTFRSERLFVQRSCAPAFLIHHIFCGQMRAPIVNQVPIIAEPFAANFDELPGLDFSKIDDKIFKVIVDKPAIELLGAPMRLPTLQPGLQLSFQVENISDYPCRFLAALLGEGVWPS